MAGRIIQMPRRADVTQGEQVPRLQDAVTLFHESANCPGMLVERADGSDEKVLVCCMECDVEIGSFSSKEWRSIVEFLMLLPANDIA